MLRRSKTIELRDDPEDASEEIVPRRPSLRRNLEALRPAARQPEDASIEADNDDATAPANAVHERLDFLRSEFDPQTISKGSQESLAALREEFRRKHLGNTDNSAPAVSLPSFGGLKFSRVLLIGVAILAGGLAAWLTLSRTPEPQPAPEPTTIVEQVPAPTLEVLVARADIAPGTRLTADLLEWQKWPEETVRAEYITSFANPEALDAYANSVAGAELIAGEPIRPEKLREAGTGYLSVMLAPGTRAVAVAVDAGSASGGFIVPDDHVDVVLTRPVDGAQVSRTIVSNVRVLAINSRFGGGQAGSEAATPEEAQFTNALATLELTPSQAELIVNATTSGMMSLVLRPLADTTDNAGAADQPLNQTIRMTSPFWTGSPQPGTGTGTAPLY